mgnify:FL=1
MIDDEKHEDAFADAAEDVHGKKIEVTLCEDCRQERCNDI